MKCVDKKRKTGFFRVSKDEVLEVMRRASLPTVSSAVRLLFPAVRFFRVSRFGGYWGVLGTPPR